MFNNPNIVLGHTEPLDYKDRFVRLIHDLNVGEMCELSLPPLLAWLKVHFTAKSLIKYTLIVLPSRFVPVCTNLGNIWQLRCT